MTATVGFDGLVLGSGDGVIEPRPWTAAQAVWAGEWHERLAPGPLLELCAGAGGIGLAATARTGRRAVLVDASAEACRWARHNAVGNGLGDLVEVRHAPFAEALEPTERFPLILADPPYVPTAEVARFPEDPVLAIDGGADGLDLHRALVAVIADHLAVGGVALVQARGADQADAVGRLAAATGALRAGPVRTFGSDRAVLALRSDAVEGRRRGRCRLSR